MTDTALFNINLDPEAIQRMLVEKLGETAIGQKITEAVSKVLTQKVGSNWDARTLVEDAVFQACQDQVRSLVIDAVYAKRDHIKEQIAAKLTDEFLNNFVDAAWKHLMKKTEREY